MTSRNTDITCMVTVVAEGRCSLVTSLIIFKYTMVYAFVQVGHTAYPWIQEYFGIHAYL